MVQRMVDTTAAESVAWLDGSMADLKGQRSAELSVTAKVAATDRMKGMTTATPMGI